MTSPRAPLTLTIAEIGELPEHQIVGGLIDEAAVACLQARLAAEGLISPIWVRRNGNAAEFCWSIVGGRHRLLAAKRLGWTEIAAEERAGPDSDTDQLRRLQIAENLDRRVLRPIERACYIMERWRKAASEVVPSVALNQQSEAVRARWSVSETISNTPVGDVGAVDAAAAAACGLISDRSIRAYRRIHMAIVAGLPDHFVRLNAHRLGESFKAMDRLAGLNPTARLMAAEAIVRAPDAVSIEDVLVKLGIKSGTGTRDERLGARAMSAFKNMSLHRKQAHIDWLADVMTAGLVDRLFARLRENGGLS